MPIDALNVLCAQVTRDLFAITKFLLVNSTFKNDMYIYISVSVQFYLLYLASSSCGGNDAFWHHSKLVKESNSFSRKHRILSLQICVRQTVRLTRKPDRLQNLATGAGMCVHCTRHVHDTSDLCSASLTHGQAYHKTSKQFVNGESSCVHSWKQKGITLNIC